MTIFWPTTNEEKQYYIDYFAKSADEQLEIAKNLIPLIEEGLELDREHYKTIKQARCSLGECVSPNTTAGDCLPHCYKCLNIRPDYYEWFHKRRMLCASWGQVPFDQERALEYFKLLSNSELR